MLIIRQIIIVLSIFGFLYPCSCMEPPPPGDAYEMSNVVFSGQVTDIIEDWNNGFMEISIDVYNVWKGAIDNQVIILTGLDDCGYYFQLNEEYLIYGYYSQMNHIWTDICTRTNLLEYASEDLDYLNGLNNGDINGDGEINVIDVVLLVSNILDGAVNENGDINQDDLLNVIDVVLLVDIILNQETIPETGLFITQQYQEDELTFFYDIEYSQRPNPYGVQYSSSRTQQEEQLQDTIFLHLDLVLPPNPENKLLPMVVMIHGGGFHGGNKEGRLQYAQDYATLGYIGCTINYRLTRQNIIQESDENLIAAVNDAVEDAMNAIRYLKTQSSIYSIDNDRIVTIGNSAGAFISLHNAIDKDESLPDQESINDYPGISSSVSASVSTGAVFPNEGLIYLNFDEDDASCLIMHAEDYDSVTDTYWEDDVIPFYEAVINSGNYAALVAQPSGSHGVGVGPFEEYSEDILPFIWNQLNLNEW